MVRLSLAWLLWPMLAVAATGNPPPSEAGLPFLRNYAPRDYGAHGQNWVVVQDPRGVIYAGNNDGVLEFDGERWRLIRTAQRTIVRALAAAPDGRIYVGGLGEIGMLEADAQGQMHYVSLMDRLAPEDRRFDDVHHVFVHGQDIYFATYARLIRLRGDHARAWVPDRAFHRAFMARDRLFIRERGRGLMRLVDDALQPVAGIEPLGEDRIDLILPWGSNEGLLIGSRDTGLYVLEGGSLRPFDAATNETLRRDLPYSGVQLPDGGYAIGTFQGGVHLLDGGGQLRGRIDKRRGLQDDTVLGMAVDRQGGLWLALDRGLSRIETDLPLTRFDERNGLNGAVLSLHRHRGVLHAGTAQGAYRLQAGADARFVPIPGLRGQTYAFLSVGEELLVGNNDGTFRIGEGAVTQLQAGVTGTTTALLASRTFPGRVYVGLWDGLALLRREDGRWIDEGRVAGVDLTVSSMLEAADGQLWLGTWNHGVARLQFAQAAEGKLRLVAQERFDASAGLPQPNDNFVQDIGGEMLFSTHQGLLRFDAGRRRFEPDPRFGELFGDARRWVVYGVGQALPDGLWMQTVDESSGLKQAGLARPRGTAWAWSPQPLAAIAGTWIEKIHVDADGGAWFGGSDGLFRLDPRTESTPAPAFRTLVRPVVAGRDEAPRFGGDGETVVPTLAHADHRLRFEFAATHYDSGDGAEYQTWLEGNDRDWSPWNREDFREYTNLREGDYLLQVRARNREGVIGTTAEYAFRILPPWYRTAWAYLAYAALAALLLHLLLRWRMARVQAENLALERVVAQRTAELRDRNAQLDESRRRAEQERLAADQARARAEEANRAKTVFLANMSHELRTPLNAVLGFAQLMDRQPARSADDRRHLATIQRSGEHLLGLINDVLSLSRIEAGVLALDVAPFDLRALIGNVCELMRMRAEAKDLWLRVDAAELPATVGGDARKLSQILLNLLGNAVKFTRDGGVTLRVRWREGVGEFVVEDSGPGIGADERAHLFEPFAQTEAGRAAKEGAGLGLALSRDMARLMGGDLALVSAPGEGARFRLHVALPQRDDVLPAPERGDRRRVRALAPGQAPPRVLVVDDIDDNRAVLCGLLRAVGFELREAADGAQALQVWRDWQPQLIWLDKRMPDMDGTEVARRIRAEEARLGRTRVAILALSASALEHQRDDILASGCDDFLPKPFREGLIFAKMAEHLGLHYVYEDEAIPQPQPPAGGAPDPARLAGLSDAWLATMRQALATGDVQAAANALATIATADPELASPLQAMLAAYRLDELDALFAAAAEARAMNARPR
jgi:signal transduction histidine kinase/ligand-binding sensor domain-containing protein/response regulator of citrate/malate metabolism